MLLDKGADINSTGKDGLTPLSGASKRGHEAVVKLLLDKGVDINTTDKDGWTPLLWALQGSYKAFKTKGANEVKYGLENDSSWKPLS